MVRAFSIAFPKNIRNQADFSVLLRNYLQITNNYIPNEENASHSHSLAVLQFRTEGARSYAARIRIRQ